MLNVAHIDQLYDVLKDLEVKKDNERYHGRAPSVYDDEYHPKSSRSSERSSNPRKSYNGNRNNDSRSHSSGFREVYNIDSQEHDKSKHQDFLDDYDDYDEQVQADIFSASINQNNARSGAPPCLKCQKRHPGECWADKFCQLCNNKGHPTKNCYKACQLCLHLTEVPHDKNTSCRMKTNMESLSKWLEDNKIDNIPKELKSALNFSSRQ